MTELPNPDVEEWSERYITLTRGWSEQLVRNYGRAEYERALEQCLAEVVSILPGLLTCDALGSQCDEYIPKWRVLEVIRALAGEKT
jgi:hypothetical protein